jgi:hypothetical protein
MELARAFGLELDGIHTHGYLAGRAGHLELITH